MPTAPVTDADIQFMLAEHAQISEDFRRIREAGLNRLNFLIAIFSGTLGGLAILSQTSIVTWEGLRLIAILSVVFLFLIGWVTFAHSIARDISTDADIRALGRIRRFFVDRNDMLVDYLTWEADDQPTRWVTHNRSFVRRSNQVILAVLCALGAGLGASFAVSSVWMPIAAGLLAFALTLWAFSGYASIRFRSARRAALQAARHKPLERRTNETTEG